MQRFDVVIALEGIREARVKWHEANMKFHADVETLMSRLLNEAAVNFMSAEEVAKASGITVKRIRQAMRDRGLNPKSGKRLLSKQAAEALANNSALMGIEPHEMDLMSPLAYLPMGEKMKRELQDKTVSQVHEVSGNPEPIIEFLPALREFVPPHADNFDTCVVCGDGECGGACEGALYVVRQVMEALDSEDDRPWFRDYLDMPESGL